MVVARDEAIMDGLVLTLAIIALEVLSLALLVCGVSHTHGRAAESTLRRFEGIATPT